MIHPVFAFALLGLSTTPLWATDCTATIDGNGAMQYDHKAIAVPRMCK